MLRTLVSPGSAPTTCKLAGNPPSGVSVQGGDADLDLDGEPRGPHDLCR